MVGPGSSPGATPGRWPSWSRGSSGRAGLDPTVRSVPAPLAALAGRAFDRLWSGDEPPLTHFAARQLSVAHWFDQADTRRVLQWVPTVGIDEGIARLADWFDRA